MRILPSPGLLAAIRNERARSTGPICAYLYDLGALTEHVRATRAALPANCEMFYAIKANAEVPILGALAPIVDGFEASSGGELAWLNEHAPGKPMIFSGPGKLDDEIRQALALGIELIHVESLGELARLARIAGDMGRTAPIALRVNLGLGSAAATRLMMAGASPFGIEEAELAACIAFIDGQPALDLQGFHIHSLSHQLDMKAHLALIEIYLDRIAAWNAMYGRRIRHLNMGGGIGINYRDPDDQIDWPAFTAGLSALIERKRAQHLALRFEFGRYLTCASGYYAAEVVDLKSSHGQWFAICRGGSHHFRTPSAQRHSHPLIILPRDRPPAPDDRPAIFGTRVNVVGQLCTPTDRLAQDVPVEELRVGDTVLFLLAGAYAWTISHHDFLRHPPPAMCFVEASLPIEKETADVDAIF
ncbi:diaminopimelate decarboxylase [Sphingomonas sp. YR710]|uniref:type III PLP-dependent enzyme n=1 Tax=Sphingomonas sp. YR710 TaxID=1882773 RepID=UPI000881DDB6|nr:type III PLP-dependent enzyme [Sphingomonas sp. YR710]SDC82460.1 diaminopimelate decarboxylase [Sphingomonas sp. YR710]